MTIPLECRDALHSVNEKILRGEIPDALESLRLRKDGTRFPAQLVFSTIINNSGEVTATSVITRDITERKNAELALKEAHERTQMLSGRILEVQENERGAIARELHDQLGQTLSAVKLNLELMQRRPEAQPLLVSIGLSIQNVGDAVQQVRTLALELRPPQLDELGLAVALRAYVQRLGTASALKITLNVQQLPPLSPGLDIVCFRIVQEALTNITRHAAAKQVQIDLRMQGDALLLKVEDDGKGFDVAAARQRAVHGHSMGVLNMEERTRLAGGSLRIESRAGAGTTIQAEFGLLPPPVTVPRPLESV